MYLFSIQSSNIIKINYELLEFISKRVKVKITRKRVFNTLV